MVLAVDNQEKVAKKYILLTGAEGTIEASAGLERLDEFTERLASGEFLKQTEKTIPCKCIDERTCQHMIEGPNAAGGTLSLFVADDLTTQRHAADDGSVVGGMKNIVNQLKAQDLPVGVHGDIHHIELEDPLSGCGANDKLAKIYNLIVRKPELVKSYVEAILGEGSVDEDTEKLIVRRAGERTDFSPGKDVFNASKADGCAAEILEGNHDGSVVVINKRVGWTLDREAIEREFGPGYSAFCADVWSFPAGAEALTDDDSAEEIRQMTVAMAYYNATVALTLCGPNMRVVTLD